MSKTLAPLALALVLVLAPVTSHAATNAELKATIQAQVQALQASSGGHVLGETITSSCINLYRNATLGSSGSDITQLQNYLIGKGFLAAGYNTGYYGFFTAQAVGKLQVSLGLVSSSADTAYGLMGPRTRAAISCNGSPLSTPSTATPPASGTLGTTLNGNSGTFSATPSSGSAPLTVTFSTTIQSGSDQNIDYGDGTSCTTASNNCNLFTHTYSKAGTYTAVLFRQSPSSELAWLTITVSGSTITTSITSSPSLSTPILSGSSVRVSYANLPTNTYENLLWQNENGEWEQVGQQGSTVNGGSGSLNLSLLNNAPSGTYKVQVRKTADMNWAVDSSTFINQSASPSLNCTLSTTPGSASTGQKVTLSWTSLGASYALWQQDSAANVLGLPATRLIAAQGSQTVTMGGKGNVTPTLLIYRDTGLSGSCSVTIGANSTGGTPYLSGITPSSASANTQVTLYGSNFANASEVDLYYANGQLGTRILPSVAGSSFSTNTISFTTYGSFIGIMGAGTYQVKVVTPAGTSNSLPLTLVSPTLTPTVSPSATIDQNSLSLSIGSNSAGVVTLKGTATNVSSVTVSLDGADGGAGVKSGPVVSGQWAVVLLPISSGSHSVTVTDADSGSNYGRTLTTGTLTVTAPTPTQIPTASIDQSTLNLSVGNNSAGVVTLKGTAANLSYVTISLDGANSGAGVKTGPVVSGQWAVVLLPVTPGTHSVRVIDADAGTPQFAQTLTTGTLTVTAPSATPTGTIDSSSLYSTSSHPTITGTASNVRSVTVGIKATNSETATVVNGRWSVTMSDVIPSGTFLVQVNNTDAGTVLTTGSLTVNAPANPTVCTYKSNSGGVRTASPSDSSTGLSCQSSCTTIRNEVFGQSDSGTCTFQGSDGTTYTYPIIFVSPTLSACPANALAQRGQTGSFKCTCPAGFSINPVWGGQPYYTDDSDICTAGAQVGEMNPTYGGEVDYTLAPGQLSYPSWFANGITSHVWGQWLNSFQITGPKG